MYTIGLDLDGVCYAWERTARYMLRRKLAREGRPIPDGLREKSAHWNAIEELVTADDWKWLWSEGVRAGLFRYGHVQRDGIDGAIALATLGDVVVVTSRPKHAIHDTTAWLNFHFDKVPYMGLHVLSHGEKKSEVRPQPNLFIDDGVHNIIDLGENTASYVGVIVFDQPWNQEVEETDKVRRGRGWDHTVELAAAHKEGRW